MMKRLLIIVIAMIGLVMASVSAMAAGSIPGDSDHDLTLTRGEMATAVLSGLSGNAGINDSRDAAWVFTMWGGKPRSIVDTGNHTVILYKPVHRVIVLGSYAIEAAKLLGDEAKIVAIDHYTKTGYTSYFPELQSLPEAGTYSKPDYEAIISLQPDLVVITTDTQYTSIDDMVDKLGKFDIPVADLVFYKYQLMDTEVAKLGYLLDSESQAQKYVSWRDGVQKNITDYLDSHPDEKIPKAYIEMNMGGNMTWGKGSNEQALFDLAGGYNVAEGVGFYSKVDPEYAIKQDPDIILWETSVMYRLGWNDSSAPWAVIDTLKARPGWTYISAVKNSRVHVIDDEVMYGPDSIAALAYIAKLMHPDMPIDPDQVYAYYLETFLGTRYPDGTMMVYPET